MRTGEIEQKGTKVGRATPCAPRFAQDSPAARAERRALPASFPLRSLCSLLFLLCVCPASVVEACSIPVFRYALDRWHADPYRLELPVGFKPDEQLSAFFRNLGSDSPVNLDIQNREIPGSHPRLLFPQTGAGAAPALWEGPLDLDTLSRLTDSPARREISGRILAGESAVWVLVESGNRAADDASAQRIEKRLRFLQSIAQLPRIDPTDPSSKLGPGPELKVKFSLLRVPGAPVSDPARSNATQPNAGSETGVHAESTFLKMLAGPKPNPALANGSWLAVVFGRGRALGAWPASEMGDEQIEEACLFLLGACSCQVKRQNPGWDLLLNVDWDKELAAVAEKQGGSASAPGPTAVAPDSNSTPVTVTIGAPDSPNITGTNPVPWLPVAAGAFVLLALAAAIRHNRGQP